MKSLCPRTISAAFDRRFNEFFSRIRQHDVELGATRKQGFSKEEIGAGRECPEADAGIKLVEQGCDRCRKRRLICHRKARAWHMANEMNDALRLERLENFRVDTERVASAEELRPRDHPLRMCAAADKCVEFVRGAVNVRDDQGAFRPAGS